MTAVRLLGARAHWGTPAPGRGRPAPDLSRHRRVERARGRCAAVNLADTPGGAAVELGERLHGAEPGAEIDLVTAVRLGQQQAEKPLLVQLVQHLGRQAAKRLVCRTRACDHVGNAPDPLERVVSASRWGACNGHERGSAVAVVYRIWLCPPDLNGCASGSPDAR